LHSDVGALRILFKIWKGGSFGGAGDEGTNVGDVCVKGVATGPSEWIACGHTIDVGEHTNFEAVVFELTGIPQACQRAGPRSEAIFQTSRR
jgi:hypothetical protein